MKLFDKKVVTETTMLEALRGHELICKTRKGKIIIFNAEDETREEYKNEDTWPGGELEEYDLLTDTDFDISVINVIQEHFEPGTDFYICYL